jgi:hypothetical protein
VKGVVRSTFAARHALYGLEGVPHMLRGEQMGLGK